MLYFIIFALFISVNCEVNKITIDINNPPYHEVGEYFFSVALDSSMIAAKFKNFDMSNARLVTLASHLSPGYLRVGGTMADQLIFTRNEEIYAENNVDLECSEDGVICTNKRNNFNMTSKQWMNLNEFAKKVGLTILFDVNCLIRNKNGTWNPENAEDLISFSNEQGYDIDWQLGNEPNLFPHTFNEPVSEKQLAKDYAQLRKILNKYPRYQKSKLVGPEVTRPPIMRQASDKYLKLFLQHSKHNVLDAVTWHQYYFDGKKASILNFFQLSSFNLLEEQILVVKNVMNQTGFEGVPMWLSETSTAYGGGVPGVSDRFAASFLWLDKLGLCAKHGLQTVVRQTLFRGNYALIDNQYNPSPDWWISVAYKRFVGAKVLNITSHTTDTIRLYGHCSARVNTSKFLAITVFGVNIANQTAQIEIEGIEKDATIESYIFTAPKGDLKSKNVLLNGKELIMSHNNEIPDFIPIILNASQMEMPPYSLAFWVIKSNEIKNCT